MEIRIDDVAEIEEISVKEFNVTEINRIKKVKGGGLRQESKTPTFRVDLSGYLSHVDGQLGMGRSQGQGYRDCLP